jgi:hypothetical protein
VGWSNDFRDRDTKMSKRTAHQTIAKWSYQKTGLVILLGALHVILMLQLVLPFTLESSVAAIDTSYLSGIEQQAFSLSSCETAWAEASVISSYDLQNPAKDLDKTIRNCGSVEEWIRSAREYPSLINHRTPLQFLMKRCKQSLSPSLMCSEVLSE